MPPRLRSSSAPAPLAAMVLACTVAGCASTVPPPRGGEVASHPRARGAAEEGKASWYGQEQHGHLTANGEHFDMYALTAAHRRLPMGTRVRVTNLKNGKSVVLRINDRGPYGGHGRIIDVSYAAARALDMLEAGVVPARVEVVGR